MRNDSAQMGPCMKSIIFALIILIAAALGSALYFYGTVEPCRMLAQDMARDSVGPVAEAFGGSRDELPEGVEKMMRALTSQYDTSTCASKLWDGWFEEAE